MTRLLVVLLFVLAGCAAGNGTQCTVGADCASGVCTADGMCLPVMDGGDPADGGPDGAVDGSPDAGPPDSAAPDAEGLDAGVPGCVPDHDGRITRAEVPVMAGLRATYRVARDAPVDTAGEVQGDGSRRWDLSADLPGDHAVLVEAQPVRDAWFADSFPGATYAARLNDAEELLGVFEATDDALLLRGVVSPAGGLMRTEVTYDPPVVVLRFPIIEDASWETDSSVSGVALGVPGVYLESYASRVDAAGEMATPFGTFDVLRVNVELTRTVGVVPTRVRTFMYVTECFGTVGTVISRDNETGEELTRAAEVRRLAP